MFSSRSRPVPKTRSRDPRGIRVVIADDHPIYRDGLSAVLACHADMEVVGEAGDGAAAVELFRARRPDVTLMDLCMPVMSGAESTSRIVREFPRARIIILAMHPGEEDIRCALDAGARGYLLKDAPAAEVVRAVRTVHRKGWVLPGALAEQLAGVVPRVGLTARELEVLGLMAGGFRNNEIARLVGGSDAAVSALVRQVLEKLGARDRTEAVVSAIQRGILRLD
jgi:DNA-binding NarL/FixJ family response regulator